MITTALAFMMLGIVSYTASVFFGGILWYGISNGRNSIDDIGPFITILLSAAATFIISAACFLKAGGIFW